MKRRAFLRRLAGQAVALSSVGAAGEWLRELHEIHSPVPDLNKPSITDLSLLVHEAYAGKILPSLMNTSPVSKVFDNVVGSTEYQVESKKLVFSTDLYRA